MKKLVFISILFVAIFVTAFILYIQFFDNSSSQVAQSTSTPEYSPVAAVNGKEVTIVATDFQFEPNVIEVSVNQPLILRVVNNGDLPHDWVLEDKGINTNIIEPKAVAELTFVLYTPGEHVFYSSGAEDREKGMEGKLIITNN